MMDEYITRNNAISAVCLGCNQQFSDEPCEPSDCTIRQSIMALPTADVVPRAEVDELKKERDEYKKHVYEDIIYVHRIKAEVAREIFEEINAIKKEYARGNIDGNELYIHLYRLGKKYTEEQKQ